MSKEVITIGTWNDNPIEWIVIDKNGNTLTAVSRGIICNQKFHHNNNIGSNSWQNSDLQKWLTEEFFTKAFSSAEKRTILPTSEPVTLLSENEAETLLTLEERALNTVWWLRTSYTSRHPRSVPLVRGDGAIGNSRFAAFEYGVRPVITIKI